MDNNYRDRKLSDVFVRFFRAPSVVQGGVKAVKKAKQQEKFS
jgi:hypothetical protein